MLNNDFEQQFFQKKVLITGGMGFIGSNLAKKLIDLGTRVTILDNMTPDAGANRFNLEGLHDKVELIVADVRNKEIIQSLIPKNDFLFNLAGNSSHVGGMEKPVEDLEVNALAQIQILQCCKELNPSIRIVYAGTRQVYGITDRQPVSETTPAFPAGYNGISKLAGELYHILSNRIYGIWATSIRMTNTYGPHMRIKDAHQNFLGFWIRQLLDEKTLSIFGTGQQVRDLNFIDEVVDALLLSVTHPDAQGQIYNLGATPISLVKLAELLIRLNGSGSYIFKDFPKERKRIDIGNYSGDYTKINNELGWAPEISLEEGLKRTLDFYKNHGEQYY